MRPRNIVDEALQKLRRGDRAGKAAAGVLDVGHIVIDDLVVFGRQRHAPHLLAGCIACFRQTLCQFVIVREQPGVFLAKCHHDGAGEGCQIDHELRLETFLNVPQHVGQDETALGIGVEHGNRLAGHRFHHIARPLRLAVRHVLDNTDGANGVDFGLALGQRHHQPGNARCTPHVALHVLHAGRRLDRDAASIERDALADESQRPFAGLAAIPLHHHHAGLMARALGHAEQGSHAQLFHLWRPHDRDFEAKLGQRLHAICEFHRMQRIGWLIDKIARQMNALGNRSETGKALFCAAHIRRQHIDVAERLCLGLLRLVSAKTIDPETGTRCNEGRHIARREGGNLGICGDRRGLGFQGLQSPGDGTAKHFDIEWLQDGWRSQTE